MINDVCSKCVPVLVALAVFAGAAGVYPPASDDGIFPCPAGRGDRDKTGTSRGRVAAGLPQTTPPAVLTAGGGKPAERGRFELP